MSVLIVGCLGSMGKRYASILNHLDIEFKGVDLLNAQTYVDTLAYKSSGIIIATPTTTHLDMIRRFSQMGKPILCEKPLVKNEEELADLMLEVSSNKIKLRMMMQYQELVGESVGDSSYNYFRHGNDGLIWDCMQIISLSNGRVELREDSPIWKCKINGTDLNISNMDRAYVYSLQRWLKEPSQDIGYLRYIHQKTIDFERRMASVNRH